MSYTFNPFSSNFDKVNKDHTKLTNIGTNTHAQIDTHIGSTSNPHSVSASDVGNGTAQWNANKIQGVTVDDTAKADGYALTYDSSSGTIIYAAGGGGGTDAESIQGVDVDDTNIADTYVLAYSSTSGNLEYVAPSSGGSGSPAGSDTQLQYNNSGSFGGISLATFDGSRVNIAGAGARTVLIGGGTASASANDSVVIGNDATDNGGHSNTVIGEGANISNSGRYQCVAIGRNATCSSYFSTAIGYNSSATYYSTAIGNSAQAGDNGLAIGYGVNAGTNVCIGKTISASTASVSTLVGSNLTAAASVNFQVIVGASCTTTAAESIAIGHNTDSASYGVGIGTNADPANNSVSIGYGPCAGIYAVKIGHSAACAGSRGIAIGAYASAGGSYSIAMQQNANASASHSLAFGYGATAATANQIVLGSPTHHYSVVNCGPVYIYEKAAALADKAGYGQLWVKNTTPCELWFTSDDGTDTQIV